MYPINLKQKLSIFPIFVFATTRNEYMTSCQFRTFFNSATIKKCTFVYLNSLPRVPNFCLQQHFFSTFTVAVARNGADDRQKPPKPRRFRGGCRRNRRRPEPVAVVGAVHVSWRVGNNIKIGNFAEKY